LKKTTKTSYPTAPLFKDGIKLKYQPPGEDPVFVNYHNGNLCKEKQRDSETSYTKLKKNEYKVQKGPKIEAGQKVSGYWVPQIEEGARRLKNKISPRVVPGHKDFPDYGGLEIGPDNEHLVCYGPDI
jgi:hypothetical protein